MSWRGKSKKRENRGPRRRAAAPGPVRPASGPKPPAPATIGELTPDPSNARRHGARNVETIAAALTEIGAARSIVIDEQSEARAGSVICLAGGDLQRTRRHELIDDEG
jgi:hypothetical protein